MSLRNQQSDTSRVVKNPLLSAVPHSIDDFVNNTILLPAAEMPPVGSETHHTEANNDATKSVIYGSEPAILDSDRFSEISLDQTVDSEPAYSAPQNVYNPLQNLEPFIAESDNSSSRDESTFNPIAQATALKESLSQLPGVASSVLSSFSNILKGTSPSPQPSTPRNEPYSDPYESTAPAPNQYQYSYYNYEQSNQAADAPAAPPPTFYSPTDSAILQPPGPLPPTDSLPSNTYRLKERKKISYAPIPGFNANNVQPPSSVSPALPPLPVPVPVPTQPSAPTQPPAVDVNASKSGSSFSLTSFFSSPLIDKIQNTVLSPPRPVEQAHSPYQAPVDISVQYAQPPPVTSSYQTPTQFFNPRAFNTQPFASSTNVPKPVAPAVFGTSSPAPHIFTPVVSETPQAVPLPIPSFPPQAGGQSFLPSAPSNPTHSSAGPSPAPSLAATPAVNPDQSIYQQSSPASVSGPPLVVSSALPPPIISLALPPSVLPQAPAGYRLKGKPLYRKPPAESSYNTIPSQIQPLPQPTFSAFTGESTPSQSIPAVSIFNPFSQTVDTPAQSESVEPPAPASFFVAPVPARVDVFNPVQNPVTLQPAPSSAAVVTSTPKGSPQPASESTFSVQSASSPFGVAAPQPNASPFASIPPPVSTPSSLPPPTLSQTFNTVPPPPQSGSIVTAPPVVSSPNPSPAPVLFAPSNPTPIGIFNPAAYQSETPAPSAAPSIDLQPAIITAPPAEPIATFKESRTTPSPFAPAYSSPAVLPASFSQPAQTTPFGIFNPSAVNSAPQPAPSPFSAFVEAQPQISPAQPTQLNSFFAPSPTYPAKSPSPAPSSHQSATAPQPTTFFNSFGSQAIQSQDFNPFRNQTSNTIENSPNDLSLDSDNNIVSAADNSINESDQSSTITEPVQPFAGAEPNVALDPSSFFNNNFLEDTPATNTSNNSNEFQIQNFFNNPPPLSDTQEVVQDKNFNFIGTNLLNKRIEKIATAAATTGNDTSETLSLASYIVEPASSAQSEFSEYAEQPGIDIVNRSVDKIYSSAAAAVAAAAVVAANQEQQDQLDSKDIFNFRRETSEPDDEMPNATIAELGTSVTTAATNIVYRPVYKHWFYTRISERKTIWTPFSFNDSMRLEEAFTAEAPNVVTTDGGRCDVDIAARKRTAVYWNSEETEVRRCSWFYKGKDSRYKPYEEDVAEQLEEEYRDASNTGEWQRKIPLTSGETVVFHGPSTMVHFLQSQSPDSWTQSAQSGAAIRPRTVKRGIDEFSIEDGEPEQVDHLLFMVHGIGAACDLKFRTIQEVVDDFRANAMQLVQSHYRNSCDKGEVGRVEVLPISWHSELHSKDTGIDEKLKAITLESIPKLRNFTNSTLLDILFYTSPMFCQQIMNAVSGNMNDIYTEFRKRNPSFRGSVSVCGHSLGSLILFDLLQHQKPAKPQATAKDEFENSAASGNETNSPSRPPLQRTMSQQVNYTIGHAGTGQAFIKYPKLEFQPKMFFALGSPIGMFVTIRGLDSLGLDFKLPTTDHFFNIFHPFDPVAYRIEALINPELASLRPVLIPHHKGRKRMHLELRETMTRFGTEIKNKISETFKATLNTVYNYATLNKNAKEDTKAIQQEVDKVIVEQLTLEPDSLGDLPSASNSFASSEGENGETELPLGKINGGRRIDHVLQEAPMEYFNEYLFALSSHVCYWESSDTTLFIMKEIYSSDGIRADTKVPQQTLTIERPASSGPSSPTI